MKMYINKLFVAFFIFLVGIVPLSSAHAQAATGNTLRTYIQNVGGFLADFVLPLLFSFAFLYFLFNIARYFIIGGASDEARGKAKRNAIYGIAAFVFLLTIWALVGVFISGLGLQRDRSICPDYFKLFNGNCVERNGTSFSGGGSFPSGNGSGSTSGGGGTSGGFSGGGSTGSTRGSGSSGGGGTSGGNGGGTDSSGSGGNGSSGGNTGTGAALAELVFGTGKDAAIFSTASIGAEAPVTNQIVNQNSTCVDGINTLALSSRTDTIQTAYAYYTLNGVKQWLDISKSGSTNLINYYTSKMRVLTSDPNAALYIVHTHPTSRYRNLGLNQTGQGPSAADYLAACRIATELPNKTLYHVVVSGNDIWRFGINSAFCPQTLAMKEALPTLEVYSYLASLEASTRAKELTDYVNSSLTPSLYKTPFTNTDYPGLTSLSPSETLALSSQYQQTAGVTINNYSSSNSFCSSLN